MKKIFAMFLIIILLFMLVGCNSESQSNLQFHAMIFEINDDWVLVETIEGKGFDYEKRIILHISGLDDIGASIGDIVNITHTETVLHTYPYETYHPIRWSIVDGQREKCQRQNPTSIMAKGAW